MVSILILIIGVFVVVFFEHFLFSVLAFSVYALVAANIFNRVSPFFFYSFLVLLGLILDVTMHDSLGVHLLSLSVSLVVLWLIGIIVPIESKFSRYLSLSVFFLFFYFSYFIISSLVLDFVFPLLPISLLIKVLISTSISVLLSFLLDKIFFSVRDTQSFEKIRLR
jgi:hypothetical protein